MRKVKGIRTDYTSRSLPPKASIFYVAVDSSGDIVVKRLGKIDAGLLLHSDNPEYPTLFRSADEAKRVQVIGRVVWSGHTFDNPDGLSRPRPKKSGRQPFDHVWI